MDTWLVFTVAGCSCKSSHWLFKRGGLAHSRFKGSYVMPPIPPHPNHTHTNTHTLPLVAQLSFFSCRPGTLGA